MKAAVQDQNGNWMKMRSTDRTVVFSKAYLGMKGNWPDMTPLTQIRKDKDKH